MAYNCVRIQLGGPLQPCGELCTPFPLQAQVLLGLLLLQAPEQGGHLPPSSVPSQFWGWAGGPCSPLQPGLVFVPVAHGGDAVGQVLAGAGFSAPPSDNCLCVVFMAGI